MENKSEKYFLIGCGAIILVIIGIASIFMFLGQIGNAGIPLGIVALIVAAVIFAFLFKACLSFWVYKDAITRGENGIMWGLVVFFVSSILVLIIYLIARKEKSVPCTNCYKQIPCKAAYCEYCGEKQQPENRIITRTMGGVKYLVSSIVSVVLMFVCMISAVVVILINDDLVDTTAWNSGYVMMSMDTTWNNEWTWKFSSASDGYHKQVRLKKNKEGQSLVGKITCGDADEEDTLVLYISQGDIERSMDVTHQKGEINYNLDEFENGKINVRPEVHGVEDVSSKLTIE